MYDYFVLQLRMSREHLHVELPVWITVYTLDNGTSWFRIRNVDLVENTVGMTNSSNTSSSRNSTLAIPDNLKVYDPGGAAMFCVVVLLVYTISVVLFMLKIVKRKIGAKLTEENRNVTDYIQKVPALKDKTARENFKRLKISIISELKRQDSVGNRSLLIPTEYSSYISRSLSSTESSPYAVSIERREGLATTGLLMAANSMLSTPITPSPSIFDSELSTPEETSININNIYRSPSYSLHTPNDDIRSNVRFTFPDASDHNTEISSVGINPMTPSSALTAAYQFKPRPYNFQRQGSARSSTSRPCVVFPTINTEHSIDECVQQGELYRHRH